MDIQTLALAFENAMTADDTAAQAEVTAQSRFEAAQTSLAQAKVDHVNADGAVVAAGKELIAGVQAIIDRFQPPAPPVEA